MSCAVLCADAGLLRSGDQTDTSVRDDVRARSCGAEHRAAGDLARGAPGDPSLVSGHHHIMLTSRVKFQPFTPTANYKYNCNDNCIYRRLVIALPRSRHLGYVTVASAGMTDSSDVVTSRHKVNRSILNGPAAVNQSCYKIAPSLLSQDYSRDRLCPWSRLT